MSTGPSEQAAKKYYQPFARRGHREPGRGVLALMCQKHPLKFAESPDLQGSEANETASLKFIVSEVSDGPKEVRCSLPSRVFRRKPSPRNDTSRLNAPPTSGWPLTIIAKTKQKAAN